jgi:hypothetical protein
MVRENAVRIAGALHQRTLSLRYGASRNARRTGSGGNTSYSVRRVIRLIWLLSGANPWRARQIDRDGGSAQLRAGFFPASMCTAHSPESNALSQKTWRLKRAGN